MIPKNLQSKEESLYMTASKKAKIYSDPNTDSKTTTQSKKKCGL